MEKEMLVEKWGEVLDAGTAPVLSDKEGMARLLENEEQYLNENSQAAADMAQYTPILVPAVRRIFPNLLANELVSVQPMQQPTGYAYALRYAYAGTDAQNAALAGATVDRGLQARGVPAAQTFGSFAFILADPTIDASAGNVTAVGASGVISLPVVYGEAGRAIITTPSPAVAAEFTVGASITVNGSTSTIVALFNNEAGYNLIFKNYIPRLTTADGEVLDKTTMKSMKMTVERVQIEAQTRKLKAEYTLELAQDLKNVHGLDAEAELINILEYEIGAELDRELVDIINQKATQTPTWTYAATGGNTFNSSDGRWEAEKLRTLYTRILSEANKVALTTRRGTANILVCSSNVVSALETLQGFMYSAVPGTVKPTLGIAKVGTLDGRFTVYLDTFATEDYVTVLYKGSSKLDAGVIYCPYVPLMMQKVIDPSTFQPRIGFMTRDAVTGSLWGTQNYQRYIPIDFTGSSLGGNGIWAA